MRETKEKMKGQEKGRTVLKTDTGNQKEK